MESGWNLSVCGLNCTVCDIMLAGKGDEEKLREIMDWFEEERGVDVEPESIVCKGCRGSLEARWSPDCGMMLCPGVRDMTTASSAVTSSARNWTPSSATGWITTGGPSRT